ncbi:TM0106 family RecB-like putative nuclease [Rhizobium sp. S95]|uniref:TM0106 family RecB-like putative nuclease n=1 Tax=Ciceribacter sichuanensis TaxID=2949647 RepID=A0AAJ1F7Q2_9HYPH|nr:MULTISPECIES: TM0106 family RecB-like putative nuclease [unclassified Ciceribacter]MCM2396731.1 TM0106 family RecB-like putative nuclease [Ciceribacter sp. S95]MCO5958177.1 TM0106 family RecB-like putative nuclease [Ciceribacter sp. S101]
MQRRNDSLLLSASDLVGHLNCRHLSGLDIEVARGTLSKPAFWDPLLQILWERGARHEQGYVEHLKAQGFDITVIDGVGVDDDAVAHTRTAMIEGHSIIVQGAFRLNAWVGRTDILRRIETPSDLGGWSYEVIDTKLARETKGGTVLQLCLYADLVASVQGLKPAYSYVVAPWSDYEPQIFRMDDYAAYYRRVRDALAIDEHNGPEIYPDPKTHCEICRWQDRCDQRRRADDHLSLVAGISKVQIDELKRQGIETAANLAVMPLPLAWKPTRGAAYSYERVREQARIQVEGRAASAMLHELLPVVPGFGLASLPAPSSGDIFFDLEGDPFAGEGGLEYLFGYSFADADGTASYTSDWAFSREDEKANFERFIDFVMARLGQHPDLHIYHFAPYEPAALKRLMGRYASREEEIDFLLRSKRFVDLYGVVRNALRASVESYSIKKLEPLYGFTRDTKLSDANMALAKVQACLELGDLEFIDDADRTVVAGYNRDDCVSTWQLRDWLETRRDELVGAGTDVPRPEAQEGAPSEKLSEWQEKINALIDQLTGDVPPDPADRTPEQHARWLLAHSLDWHRREQKALWWEYFRLSDLASEDLLEERAGLSGLSFIGATGGTAKAPIHRYSFPPQETELRGGESLRNMGGAHFGTVEEMSLDERWVDIKKRGDTADVHSEAVFAHKVIDADVLAKALVRVGEHVAANGMEGDGRYRAARDLLMRMPPRIGGQSIRQDGEPTLDAALRIAPHLQTGVFPIQGPPGAGKTHTGARMICALVQAGKTVGVTANSHKVIRNLLDAVVTAADAMGVDVQCMQKPAEKEDDIHRLRFTTKAPELLGAIGHGVHVGGGTAWLWASPDAAEAVDVLFIDEAAQMALANVLAVSQAASTIVLLGDPQQLDQPMQGSHPEGTDVSSLHHILGGDQTIADDRGLFLAETWRLHPDICAYTSELFYGGRLHPRPGLEVQEIRSGGRVSGAGLRYVPVPTKGNQSSSPEEADCVRDLVDEILGAGTTWIDKHGVEAPVTLNEILIIAPYNAQVIELQDRIPGGRIGTVDKFQGQEAPIVIYSMTTSSYADAPRGMEFLYSLNRLNVATSRAKCICVLVASPSVFEAQCRTPRQMQLANAFCRYLERASVV